MIEKRLAGSQLASSHVLLCRATASPADEGFPGSEKNRLEELIPSLRRGSTVPSSRPVPCCGHVLGPSQGECGRGMGAGERQRWGCAHPAELLGQLVLR